MAYRHNDSLKPKKYILDFSVELDRFTFYGKEEFQFSVEEECTILRLHCEKLEIKSLALQQGSEAVEVSFSCEDGMLNVNSSIPLKGNAYRLLVSFSGKLNDDLSGFYRSKYTASSGDTKYLATTQFEAPYARKCFPCIDDPGFKAEFSVTLNIPIGLTGLSNMPVNSEEICGERKRITFETTPPMSTYLLYMGVGEFDYIEEKRGERTLRVYGVNGRSQQGTFALTFAADTLEFFEEYSDVAYPLPKLDLIAIPDFSAGAMENWGAITFREVLLYVDEKETSLFTKKRVAEVIAHELWHQWSGNLVTMKWWDDLWLNEAFATFIAYKAVDTFYPEWNIWDEFLDADTKRAFEMDMLSSTHPISVPVKTPNEVEEIFDHISYGKGGSVLKMIEDYIGNDSFQKGVSAYLKNFAYKNAEAEQLWDILEQHSGQPVKDVLLAWVTIPGFPLVSVTETEDGVSLRQECFQVGNSDTERKWPIPLTWMSDKEAGSLLFREKTASISVSDNYIKCNHAQTGFYRTLYQKKMYETFGLVMNENNISIYDRWGLLDDLWACVFAGHTSLSTLLDFLDCYKLEKAGFVLREIEDIIDTITLLLQLPDKGKVLYNRYCSPFTDAFARVGFDSVANEVPEIRALRPPAIKYLIKAGNNDVIEKACTLCQNYFADGTINPDIRSACLSALAYLGTRRNYEAMRTAYENKNGIEEKLVLLAAMGQFEDKDLLTEYLNYSLTSAVRRQDLGRVFSAASWNAVCPAIFFEWVRTNWEKLSHLRESHFVFMRLLETVITTAPDTAVLSAVRQFIDNNCEGFKKTRANAFEKAGLYIRFRERESAVDL
jgi:tricorn protease interacting factor F2/3